MSQAWGPRMTATGPEPEGLLSGGFRYLMPSVLSPSALLGHHPRCSFDTSEGSACVEIHLAAGPQGPSVKGTHFRERAPPPAAPAPSRVRAALGSPSPGVLAPAQFTLTPCSLPLPGLWWLWAPRLHGQEVSKWTDFLRPLGFRLLWAALGFCSFRSVAGPGASPSLGSLLLLTAHSSLSSPSGESFWIPCLFPVEIRG